MSNNNDCYKYKIKWWNIFIPSLTEYKKLCESSDKTYMFIIVMLRTILYCLLFYIFYNTVLHKWSRSKLTYVGLAMLSAIIVANIFSLILVFFKQQLIPKKQIIHQKDIHFPIKIPKPIFKTRAELKLEAILREEANARFELLLGAIQKSRLNIKRNKENEYEMKRVLFNHLFYDNPNVISSI
uniref:Transmembrane protein n=1 Tax=Mimivirus LCMiAC02 TaxID=2506609 RepID=A0A481Z1Q2_9VIRU|nr:MAG: hypothetical protein LCMiAC02_00780 [Mimivirus LCMiAC02]